MSFESRNSRIGRAGLEQGVKPHYARYMRTFFKLMLLLIVLLLNLPGCSKSDTHKRPTASGEQDQPVKRLREDTETELQDLRGRWLATEGLLIRLRDKVTQLQTSISALTDKHTHQLTALEITVETLTAELYEIKHGVTLPGAEQRNRARITHCYEEIHCARKADAKTDISPILRRYGFKDEDSWTKVWDDPEREEQFRKQVEARAKRLCP